MRKKKFVPVTLENIRIEQAAAEGVSLSRHEGKVLFIDYGVPGDLVDVQVYKSKKSFAHARITQLKEASPDRVKAVCSYFGTCGGCKWQHADYAAQLRFKAQQVYDHFERIGQFDFPKPLPILGCDEIYGYRNKLDFSCSHKRWFTAEEIGSETDFTDIGGIGFHVPGRFDKIIDIEQCHLMPSFQNEVRNEIRRFCKEQGIPLYNLKEHEGALRSIIFRHTSIGQWMVIVQFAYADHELIQTVMKHIHQRFPEIHSLLYIINTKKNDTIYDQDILTYAGESYITEQLEDLSFIIQPKSFFQTNSKQTLKLYQTARDFAQLTGNERVYDLYTGVGSIANFVARQSNEVIGIEYVEDAVKDARMNSERNAISNTVFYAGDMKDLLNDSLLEKHGKADVIITDPPRAGMHEDVSKRIIEMQAERIVYISCNPATQARDLSILQSGYSIEKVQPVDMFPHTHHVENVVLLTKKI